MRFKTKKNGFYTACIILIVALTLFSSCVNSEKEQLGESICVITSDGCTRIINRGTKLPTSFTDTFSNLVDNQKDVQVTLYQGEDSNKEMNRFIGKFDFPISNTARARDARIQITILIDQSKRLTIVAKDMETDHQDEIFAGLVK